MSNTRNASRRPWLGCTLASMILTAPLAAELACDGPPEGFNQGLPPGWTVVDAAGSGLLWTDVTACGEGANFTGGGDGAACVSSDGAGLGAFASELRSPLFDLITATNPALRFLANYQSFAGADRLEVDISVDQGASWTNC